MKNNEKKGIKYTKVAFNCVVFSIIFYVIKWVMFTIGFGNEPTIGMSLLIGSIIVIYRSKESNGKAELNTTPF